MPISEEEGTSTHHLSTMPELPLPPLSLRMPCPEGIRQRRPEGKGMRTTTRHCGLGGAASISSSVTPGGYPGGHSRQPLGRASGLIA